MYDQTNKLWFKIISFIVLETFLFTIADISWAANYRENRGSQEALMDQRTKDSRDKLSADALSDKLVLTQPAMPYMGFEQVITKGQIEAMPIIDTTISGLSIAGNDLPTIFKTLKTSGCTVAEAGFGAVRQGFNKKEIYHALIKAGYDKDEVNTLLGGLLKAEEDAKVQETDSEESKTGPPLLKDKKAQKEEEEALKAKEGIFEIPKVTDMPVEKEPAKIIESTTKESAILRQTVEFVRIMINEGKRGAELIRILKKAGLTDERIINALAQMGFNLKDIITIFKEANISCTEIVQSIHKAQVNYSDKEIYEALLKAGFTDKDIVSAFKAAGISAGDILKIAADLSRSMTDIAQAMVDAGFRFADIARAYVLKAMKGVWDNSINLVNCAVRAFDAFLTNIGRKFASKEDLAYELIVDDILATGEVEIKGKDVMTSMMAIKNVAQKYGIGLEGFKLSIESLKELNQNAIILLDSDHWVTIVSIDGDQVTIIDNGQEQVISLTELKIRWDGTTLALNQNGQGLKYNQLLDLQMRQIRGGRSGIGGFFSSIWKGICKVFEAIWKVIKSVLLSSVFRWIMVIISVVLTIIGVGVLLLALIMATLMALRTYAAGGSFGDCLKAFALTFVTTVVCAYIGNAVGTYASTGTVSFSGALSSAASQSVTTAITNAAITQAVGLAVQYIGKQIGLDQTAWGRVIMAVVTAVLSAYASYAVSSWMNDTPATEAPTDGSNSTNQNNNTDPNTGGDPTAGNVTNTSPSGQPALPTQITPPPTQPVIPYSSINAQGAMSFNWAAATVTAITAAAQQISYEIAVANKWDPFITNALTTIVGGLTSSIAGAAIATGDAKVWNQATQSYDKATTFGEAFAYYAKSALPGMISKIVEGAVSHAAQKNGWDPQMTSVISSTLSTFSSGLTSWAAGNPAGGPSTPTSFFQIAAKSLAAGAMEWSISEQAKLADMDATDLHIMYAVIGSVYQAQGQGKTPSQTIAAGLSTFAMIYINAASMGVGTTAGTSYQNATAAFQLTQFADRVVNANTWKQRDNLQERMEKAGYKMSQGGEQKKIGFWEAYLAAMSDEVSTAAKAATTQIATTGIDVAFLDYRASQTQNHFLEQGWATQTSNGIQFDMNYKAQILAYLTSNMNWNSATANLFGLMQSNTLTSLKLVGSDIFSDLSYGKGVSAIYTDSTVFKAGLETLANNAYTYLNTGNGTSVTIRMEDVEFNNSNLKPFALQAHSKVTTTSIAYLQGTDKLVTTVKVADGIGNVKSWNVFDTNTGFLMASSSKTGLWAEYTKNQAKSTKDQSVYDVLFKNIDAQGNISKYSIGSGVVTASMVRNANDQLVINPQSVKFSEGVLNVTMNGKSTDLAIQYNAYTGAMNIDSARAKSVVNVGAQFQSSLNGRTYTIQLNSENALVAVSEQSMTFDSKNKLNASDLIGMKSDAYLTGSFTAVYDLTGVVSLKGENKEANRTGIMFKIGDTGQSFLLMNNNLVSLSGNNLSILSGKLYSDNFNTHLKDRVELIQSGEGAGQAGSGLNHIYLTTNTQTGDIYSKGEISIQKDKFVITNNDAIYTDANTKFTLYLTDQTSGKTIEAGDVGPNSAGVIIDNTYLQVFKGTDSIKMTEQTIKDDAGNKVYKVTVATLNTNNQVEIKESYHINANKQRVVQYSMLESGKPVTHFALPNQKIAEAYKGNVNGMDVFFDAQVNDKGTELTKVQYFIKPLANEKANVQLFQTFDLKTQTLGIDFARAGDIAIGYRGQISGHHVFYTVQVNAEGTAFNDKTFSTFTYDNGQKVNGLMYQLTKDGPIHFALENNTVRFKAGDYAGPDGTSRTVYYNATVKTDPLTNKTDWVQSDLFVVSQEKGIQYGMLYNSNIGDKRFALVGETVSLLANKDMQPVNAVLYVDYTVTKTAEGLRMQTEGRLYSFIGGEKHFGANVESMGNKYFYEFNSNVMAPVKEVNGETVFASAKMTEKGLTFTGQLYVNQGGENVAVLVVRDYRIETRGVVTKVDYSDRISTNLKEASTTFLYDGESFSSLKPQELGKIAFQYNDKTYTIKEINGQYLPLATIDVKAQSTISGIKTEGVLTGTITLVYNIDDQIISFGGQQTVDGYTGIFMQDVSGKNQILIENSSHNQIKVKETNGIFNLEIISANAYVVDVNLGSTKQFDIIKKEESTQSGLGGKVNRINIETINSETHIVKSMVTIEKNNIVFKDNDVIINNSNNAITIGSGEQALNLASGGQAAIYKGKALQFENLASGASVAFTGNKLSDNNVLIGNLAITIADEKLTRVVVSENNQVTHSIEKQLAKGVYILTAATVDDNGQVKTGNHILGLDQAGQRTIDQVSFDQTGNASVSKANNTELAKIETGKTIQDQKVSWQITSTGQLTLATKSSAVTQTIDAKGALFALQNYSRLEDGTLQLGSYNLGFDGEAKSIQLVTFDSAGVGYVLTATNKELLSIDTGRNINGVGANWQITSTGQLTLATKDYAVGTAVDKNGDIRALQNYKIDAKGALVLGNWAQTEVKGQVAIKTVTFDQYGNGTIKSMTNADLKGIDTGRMISGEKVNWQITSTGQLTLATKDYAVGTAVDKNGDIRALQNYKIDAKGALVLGNWAQTEVKGQVAIKTVTFDQYGNGTIKSMTNADLKGIDTGRMISGEKVNWQITSTGQLTLATKDYAVGTAVDKNGDIRALQNYKIDAKGALVLGNWAQTEVKGQVAIKTVTFDQYGNGTIKSMTNADLKGIDTGRMISGEKVNWQITSTGQLTLATKDYAVGTAVDKNGDIRALQNYKIDAKGALVLGNWAQTEVKGQVAIKTVTFDQYGNGTIKSMTNADLKGIDTGRMISGEKVNWQITSTGQLTLATKDYAVGTAVDKNGDIRALQNYKIDAKGALVLGNWAQTEVKGQVAIKTVTFDQYGNGTIKSMTNADLKGIDTGRMISGEKVNWQITSTGQLTLATKDYAVGTAVDKNGDIRALQNYKIDAKGALVLGNWAQTEVKGQVAIKTVTFDQYGNGTIKSMTNADLKGIDTGRMISGEKVNWQITSTGQLTLATKDYAVGTAVDKNGDIRALQNYKIDAKGALVLGNWAQTEVKGQVAIKTVTFDQYGNGTIKSMTNADLKGIDTGRMISGEKVNWQITSTGQLTLATKDYAVGTAVDKNGDIRALQNYKIDAKGALVLGNWAQTEVKGQVAIKTVTFDQYGNGTIKSMTNADLKGIDTGRMISGEKVNWQITSTGQLTLATKDYAVGTAVDKNGDIRALQNYKIDAKGALVLGNWAQTEVKGQVAIKTVTFDQYGNGTIKSMTNADLKGIDTGRMISGEKVNWQITSTGQLTLATKDYAVGTAVDKNGDIRALQNYKIDAKGALVLGNWAQTEVKGQVAIKTVTFDQYGNGTIKSMTNADLKGIDTGRMISGEKVNWQITSTGQLTLATKDYAVGTAVDKNGDIRALQNYTVNAKGALVLGTMSVGVNKEGKSTINVVTFNQFGNGSITAMTNADLRGIDSGRKVGEHTAHWQITSTGQVTLAIIGLNKAVGTAVDKDGKMRVLQLYTVDAKTDSIVLGNWIISKTTAAQVAIEVVTFDDFGNGVISKKTNSDLRSIDSGRKINGEVAHWQITSTGNITLVAGNRAVGQSIDNTGVQRVLQNYSINKDGSIALGSWAISTTDNGKKAIEVVTFDEFGNGTVSKLTNQQLLNIDSGRKIDGQVAHWQITSKDSITLVAGNKAVGAVLNNDGSMRALQKYEINQKDGSIILGSVITKEVKGEKAIQVVIFNNLGNGTIKDVALSSLNQKTTINTKQGDLTRIASFEVQAGNLVAKIKWEWKVSGSKKSEEVRLSNYKNISFELNGKTYKFQQEKVDGKYVFTPLTHVEYNTENSSHKAFLMSKTFQDINGRSYKIDTNLNKKVTFIYDISNNLISLKGESHAVEGMISKEFASNYAFGGGMAYGYASMKKLDIYEKFNGVILTSSDAKGKTQQLLLLDGNHVSMKGDALTIESGRAITLTEYDTGLQAAKDKVIIWYDVQAGASPGTSSNKKAEDNIINTRVVDGRIVINKNQTINLQNTGQGTEFVLKDNDYLNNLSTNNSIQVVSMRTGQTFEIGSKVKAYVNDGEIVTYKGGTEVVNYNDTVTRWARQSKEWAFTEEANKSWKITNKVVGALQTTYGAFATVVSYAHHPFTDTYAKQYWKEFWASGSNKLFNAGVDNRTFSEIGWGELAGGALIIPGIVAVTVAAVATFGGALAAIPAGASAFGAITVASVKAAAITFAWQAAAFGGVLAVAKAVDIASDQGFASLFTKEAFGDIAGAIGEGIKIAIYSRVLGAGMGITSKAIQGATALTKLQGIGLNMISQGLGVAKFAIGFHVFGKAINTLIPDSADGFIATTLRNFGQGTVEDAILSGFVFGLVLGAPPLSAMMKFVEGVASKAPNALAKMIYKSTLSNELGIANVAKFLTTFGGETGQQFMRMSTILGVITGGGEVLQRLINNPSSLTTLEGMWGVLTQAAGGASMGLMFAAIMRAKGPAWESTKQFLSRFFQEAGVEQTASNVLQNMGMNPMLAEVLVEFLPGGGGTDVNFIVQKSTKTGNVIRRNSGNIELMNQLGDIHTNTVAEYNSDVDTGLQTLKQEYLAEAGDVSLKGKTINEITDTIQQHNTDMSRSEIAATVADALGMTVGMVMDVQGFKNISEFNKEYKQHGLSIGTTYITEGIRLGNFSLANGMGANYYANSMSVQEVRTLLDEQFGFGTAEKLGLNSVRANNSDNFGLIVNQLSQENQTEVYSKVNTVSLRQYAGTVKIDNIDKKVELGGFRMTHALVSMNTNIVSYMRFTGINAMQALNLYNLNGTASINLIREKLQQNSDFLNGVTTPWNSLQELAQIKTEQTGQTVNVETILFNSNITVQDLFELSNINKTQFEKQYNVKLIETKQAFIQSSELQNTNINEKLQGMLDGDRTISLQIFDNKGNIVLEFDNMESIKVSHDEAGNVRTIEVVEVGTRTEYQVSYNAQKNGIEVVSANIIIDQQQFVVERAEENGKEIWQVNEGIEVYTEKQKAMAKQINSIARTLELEEHWGSDGKRMGVRNDVNQFRKSLQIAFDSNTLWEIPAGTGKTAVLFAFSAALANLVSGKKVIFILHNDPLFAASVNDKQTTKFFEALNMGTPMEFTETTVNELEQGNQETLSLIKDSNVVYMKADAWGFFALGAQQSTKWNPKNKVVKEGFEVMFKDSKIIHDEVDTAFSKNRFQQGLNPRPLSIEEKASANFVTVALRTREINGQVIGMVNVIEQPDGTTIVEESTDAGIKRISAERSLLQFSIENRVTGEKREINYDDFKAMQHKHQWEIKGVAYNQQAKQAVVEHLNEHFIEQGITFKYENGDIVPAEGVQLSSAQARFLSYVKGSMAGRAKVMRMYEGEDVGYNKNEGRDQDKYLIKPFANKSIAPSLQLGDPFIAAHSEIVFKDLKAAQIFAEANETEKKIESWKPLLDKVGVSGRSRVTTMARAIIMAKKLGADFSGFSGTVEGVKNITQWFYGSTVSLHRNADGKKPESRLLSTSTNVTYNMSSVNALDEDISITSSPLQVILDGQSGVDEHDFKMAVIQKYKDAGFTVIVKDQSVNWELYRNGTVETEKTTGEIERFLEVENRVKLMAEGKPVREEGEKVVFFFNLSATRGTDASFATREIQPLIEKAELSMTQDKSTSYEELQVHAFFNEGTTDYDAEQLIKRDRGLKRFNEETGQFEFVYQHKLTGEQVFKRVDGEDNYTPMYNTLNVHFIGAELNTTPALDKLTNVLAKEIGRERASEIAANLTPEMTRSDIQNILSQDIGQEKATDIITKVQLSALFEENGVRAQERMLHNGLLEIYDTVTVKFLEGLRANAEANDREIEAEFIDEMILDFSDTTGMDQNIKLQDSAQSSVEALQKKIDGIIEHFEAKLQEDPTLNALSSENYAKLQQMVKNKPKLQLTGTARSENIPRPIALTESLAEAVESTNYYIREQNLPDIAPLSGPSMANVQTQTFDAAAEILEGVSAEAKNEIKQGLKDNGLMKGEALTHGGVLFIDQLKQLVNASETFKNAIIGIASDLPGVKSVDLPDDVVQKWARILWSLIGAEIVSVNVTSKATVSRLFNTIQVMDIFSNVIDDNPSVQDWITVQQSDDSLAVAKLALKMIDKEKHAQLHGSIEQIVNKQDAINNKAKELKNRITYFTSRVNFLSSSLLAAREEKVPEGAVSKSPILRSLGNLRDNIIGKAKQFSIGLQLSNAQDKLTEAENQLAEAELVQKTFRVTLNDYIKIADSAQNAELNENPLNVAVLFNPNITQGALEKANATMQIINKNRELLQQKGLGPVLDSMTIEGLINIANVGTDDRQKIIAAFIGDNDVTKFNNKLRILSVLLKQGNQGVDTFMVSVVQEVMGQIQGVEVDAEKLAVMNWFAGSTVTEEEYQQMILSAAETEKGYATYQAGLKQSAEGDYEAAIQSFTKAIALVKGNKKLTDFEAQISFELGLAYSKAGKKVEAIQVFNNLTSRQGNISSGTVARAYFEIARNEDHPAQAIQAYEKAAELGKDNKQLKGMIVEAFTNIMFLANGNEQFAQQFAQTETALNEIKKADIENRTGLADGILTAIGSFKSSMPKNEKTETWLKSLTSIQQQIHAAVSQINKAADQEEIDKGIISLVSGFDALIRFVSDYSETEKIEEKDAKQTAAIRTMVSEVKAKIEQIGEGKIEIPATGTTFESGLNMTAVEVLSGDVKTESMVVSEVVNAGFSRTLYDGTKKSIKTADVKIISEEKYVKQQMIAQGSTTISKDTPLRISGNENPIILKEEVVIKATQDGSFTPVEAMADEYVVDENDKSKKQPTGREYKFTVDKEGNQKLQLWNAPPKERLKADDLVWTYGKEELRMKEVLVEEIKEGLFVPSTAMSETKSGIKFMVKIDETGTIDDPILVFMPGDKKVKVGETQGGENILLKDNLSLLTEDGQLKESATAVAVLETDDSVEYMAILNNQGELKLINPNSSIHSISHIGFGDEKQANRNIANGMLKKAFDQGKITQKEYEQRLGQTGTDLADDINITPDRVINDSSVFIIDADYLSSVKEGEKDIEQHVSAGLRRGAEEGKINVYITKKAYEELKAKGEKELLKTVMHEQAEVNYLRKEAVAKFENVSEQEAYQKMSDLLKKPSNQVEAKRLIAAAHEFAQNIPVLEETGLRGVAQLISGAKVPVVVIDLGNAGFDIADILAQETTIASDKTPQDRKKQQTAQQIAELVNSGEYKMVVIPGDSGDINADELQRAYELLDIEDTAEGQVTVIAHAAGTKIAADSMRYVDINKKSEVKYLLLSPRMEADKLAAIMKDAQVAPEQVMTVSREGDFPSLLGSSDVVDTYGSGNNSWMHVQIREKEIDGKKISEIKGHSGMMIGLLEQYNDYVRINGTKNENIFSVAGIYRDFIHGEFESIAGENLGVTSEMVVEILAALPKEVRDAMVPTEVYKAMMQSRKPSAQSQAIFENLGSIQPAPIAGMESTIKPAAALTNL